VPVAKVIHFRREAHMTSRAATALGFILAVMGLIVAGIVALPHTAGAERGIRVGQVAPEITGGPWVNSAPLSLGALRGRVVFVEFWTYG
jgi:hypothetical protein